jgi:hemerythrin superfamily protein
MPDQQTSRVTATELLRGQHEVVNKMLNQMEELQGSDRQDLFDCLRATLAIHETAEEEIVHPAARKLGDTAEHVVEARLEEEHAAKKMLANLEKIGADADEFDELFAAFRTAVLHHSDAEELEVFTLLETSFDEDHLVEMADAIGVAEMMAPTHPHPHVPDSALGNMIVGPFAALADKVRDKLRAHEKAKAR